MLKTQRLEGKHYRAHYEPSHLDLQCLQIQLLLCLALYAKVLYEPCCDKTVFGVTTKLICVFVFAYAKSRFSHNEAHI